MDTLLLYILSAAALIILLFLIRFCSFCGKEKTCIVISFLGKVSTVEKPGLYIGIPFIRKIYKFNTDQKIVLPVRKYHTSDYFTASLEIFFYFTVTEPAKLAPHLKTFNIVFLQNAFQITADFVKQKKFSEILTNERKTGQAIAYIMNKDKRIQNFGIAVKNADVSMRFPENIDAESHWFDKERNPYTYKLTKK